MYKSLYSSCKTETAKRDYVMVVPEDTDADLEHQFDKTRCRQVLKPRNGEKTSAENKAERDLGIQNHKVSLCGADSEMTSSVFRGLYAEGASRFGASKPENLSSSNDSPNRMSPPGISSVPNILCGMPEDATSSDVVTRLFLAGIDSVVEAQDQMMCLWEPEGEGPRRGFYDDSSSSCASNSPDAPQCKQGQESRVLDIAEDLNKDAPELIQRRNLLPMIRQTEQRLRGYGRQDEQKGGSRARSTADNGKHSNQVQNYMHLKSNESSDHDSDEYPSDIDDFLEYARMVVDVENTSYDSASFREFESALQESIRNHFLDDADEDDDSLSSATSYSGYDGDARHSRRILEENSLISDASLQRVTGSIAHKKWNGSSSRNALDNPSPQLEEESPMPVWEATQEDEEEAAASLDPVAPLVILSDGEDLGASRENEETCYDRSSTGMTGFHAAKRHMLKTAHYWDNEEESILDLSAMMSASTISRKRAASTKGSTMGSTSSLEYSYASSNRRNAEQEYDNNSTHTNRSTLTGIKRQLKFGNRQSIGKYSIDPTDNSVVSDTPLRQGQRRIRKRRFRKKRVQIISEDESFQDGENDEHQADAAQNVNQTVENLAFLLGNSSRGPRDDEKSNLTEVNRDALLQKLKIAAPGLHEAVIRKIQNEYRIDRRQDGSPSNTRAVDDDATREFPCPEGEGSAAGSPSNHRTKSVAPPVACSTPDRVYWADNSREYDSPQRPSAVRVAAGVAEPNRLPTRTQRSRLHSVAQRTPIANGSSTVDKAEAVMDGFLMQPSSPDESLKEADEWRGSYWSDILRISDDQPSEEVPSISVDDIDTSFIFQKEGYKIGNSMQADGSYLDVMIDSFLVSKIERLTFLMRERQVVMARRQKVFEQLKRTPSSLLRRTFNNYVAPILSTMDDGSQHVQRGRALIAKIQRRRRALTFARQQQQECDYNGINVPTISEPSAAASPMSSAEAPMSSKIKQTTHNSGQRIDENLEDVRVEEYLTGPVPLPSSSSPSVSLSQSEKSRNVIRNVKEKRKKGRESHLLGRSAPSNTKKALHESMDSARENADTVRILSTRFKSPTKQSMVVSFKKKKRKGRANRPNYEALPDINNSFCASPEMKSSDILQALQPPSPESPIREYRDDFKGVAVDNDIACLNALASGDLSGDDGRVLVFSDTERSGSSPTQLEPVAVGDSFNDIIDRTIHNNEESIKNDDVFFNIHKKCSPTSIADFFNEGVESFPRGDQGNPKWNYSAALNEEDGFVHQTMEMFTLHGNDQQSDPFDMASFVSPTKFSI